MSDSTTGGLIAAPHPRLAYIDTLRALACLWVIVYHAKILWTLNSLSLGISLADGVLKAGDLGVDLFLVLSGFCLALPLLRKQTEREARIDYKSWMSRRAWRILPPYYFALALFSAALAVPVLAHQMIQPARFLDWPLHILMLHNLTGQSSQSIVGSFWSLALEFQLYALFPILLFVLRKTGLQGLAIFTAFLSVVWAMFCRRHFGPWPDEIGTTISWYYAVPGRAVEFAFGMVAAACIARPRVRQSTIGAMLAIIFIPASIWLFTDHARIFMQSMRVSPLGMKSLIAALGFSGLLVALAPVDRQIHRFRILRPITEFGAVSFSAYLLQEPLLRYTGALLRHFGLADHLTPTRFVLICAVWIILVLVPVTVCYYVLAERPYLRGAPKWLTRKPFAAAQGGRVQL